MCNRPTNLNPTKFPLKPIAPPKCAESSFRHTHLFDELDERGVRRRDKRAADLDHVVAEHVKCTRLEVEVARAPADVVGSLEDLDREVEPRALQEIGRREPGVAGADNCNVDLHLRAGLHEDQQERRELRLHGRGGLHEDQQIPNENKESSDRR